MATNLEIVLDEEFKKFRAKLLEVISVYQGGSICSWDLGSIPLLNGSSQVNGYHGDGVLNGHIEELATPRLNGGPALPYQELLSTPLRTPPVTTPRAPGDLDKWAALPPLSQPMQEPLEMDFNSADSGKEFGSVTSPNPNYEGPPTVDDLELQRDAVNWSGPRGPKRGLTALIGPPDFFATSTRLKKKMSASLAAYAPEEVVEEVVTHCPRWATTIHFKVFVDVVILLSIINLHVLVDRGYFLDGNAVDVTLMVVDVCLTCFFLFELAMGLAAQRRRFFKGPDGLWNRFDTTIIIVTSFLMVLSMALGGASLDYNVMAIIRASRFLQILRVGRVFRRFRRMQRLVELAGRGLMSIAPLIPCACVLFYFFSVVIAHFVAVHISNTDVGEADLDNLEKFWGSVGSVMHTLAMCVSGGHAWAMLADTLKPMFSAYFCFAAFMYIIVFMIAMLMAVLLNGTDTGIAKVKAHMRRQREFEGLLGPLFHERPEAIDFEMLQVRFEDPAMVSFLKEMDLDVIDAENVFFMLAGDFSQTVALKSFIHACIKLQATATNMDLMSQQIGHLRALEAQSRNLRTMLSTDQVNNNTLKHSSSLMSNPNEHEDVKVVPSSTDGFIERMTELCQARVWGAHSIAPQLLADTVARVLEVVNAAQGGCGIVIAPNEAFASIRKQFIYVQVVDRNKKWPRGYMTERLKNGNVREDAFMVAMKDFTEHSDEDKWPAGHVASSLPKDGFFTVNLQGKLVKCAARLVGMPAPPYKWNAVGTRHFAGLSASWALRSYPHAVVVRSDSGTISCIVSTSRPTTALVFSYRCPNFKEVQKSVHSPHSPARTIS